jgi:hypothetical protein
MIRLPDDQVTGLVAIMLTVAEAVLESAIRRNIFGISELEWFGTDVRKQIDLLIPSDLAKAAIYGRMDEMMERLSDPDIPMST